MNYSNRFKARFWRGLLFAPLAVAFILSCGSVYADDIATITNPDDQIQALSEYWTVERMQNAIPAPMPEATGDESLAQEETEAVLTEDLKPVFSPGWKPGSGPQPDPATLNEMSSPETLTTPPFSPPGSSSDWINYAPFDRWTWYGRYLTYPTSTIGKLFFRPYGGGSAVCSASVISRRTIATAGHCISDGYGHFHSNYLFCPSYNRNGVNPSAGCWGWSRAIVPSYWFNNRCFDRDYGCIVTSPTGTRWATNVGNVTGWTGRAANFRIRNHTTAWGYPAASPFRGYHIITCASTEWYQRNMYFGDGQYSKYIGCDQTGGCSGGPWWLSIRHPNISNEYPPLDGSSYTDPGQNDSRGPFLNGVNSHRYTSAWVNEIGAAEFLNSSDPQDSESVFAACFAYE